MRRLLLAVGLSAILGATAGCAEGYGYNGGVASGYGGYYDDFYGPYYDGYWRNDGFFYYRSAPRRPFIRDDGRHFRRDVFPGAREFRGAPRRGGMFHRGPRR